MNALPFAFAYPAILGALVALPVIWWLLRLTPPRPKAEVFPPLKILATVLKREETPSKSPWWLTLLRMALAAAVILALADPVVNPRNSGIAGSVYDSRAVRDLDRLVAFMQLPVNQGRRLLVIGFADASAGSSAAATMMSNDRADLIATELMARGVAVQHARGMGAQSPLVNAGGSRYRNERVEVWLL